MSLSAGRRDDLVRLFWIGVAVVCVLLIGLAAYLDPASSDQEPVSKAPLTPAKLKQMETEFNLGCSFADTDIDTAVICNSGQAPEQLANP